jgi:hypothetical protein
MVERLSIPADEVPEKCADYYLNFGTTLAGLVAHGHRINYDEWHAYVHGSLPYEEYLKVGPCCCCCAARVLALFEAALHGRLAV